jgi:tetratricopeptide (TPR) repeat protein
MASMIPPGLLPESPEPPRRSPSSWVLAAVVCAALLSLLGAGFQIRRLARERDHAVEQVEALVRKWPEGPPLVRPVDPQRPAPDAPAVAPPIVPPPSPARAPDVRVLPSRALDPQHIAQGLQEFRAGRFDQAERQFFRAFPDSLLYLALTSLAQARYQESVGFLLRAMATDPNWLRKVKPGDLFGSRADYDRVVRTLEEQLEKDPINPDLKTLLAYLRYHDKGAPYAKALLIEATNAQPDHEAAKAFLEALGP